LQAHAANYSREEWEDEDIYVNHEEAQFLLVSGPPARPSAVADLKPLAA
jgi:hypothetical protein